MVENTVRTNERELVINRIFDAPLEKVWKAWTEPEQLMRWWGPNYFSSPACKVDLRVGGKYLFCMRSPDGQDFWSTGVYRAIEPMHRLVYTDSFSDPEGNVVSADYYGMSPDFPRELLVTLTFEDLGNNKTKLTLRHSGMPAGEQGANAEIGWNQSLDKLAESL